MKVGIGLLSAVFGIGGGFGIVLSGLIVDNLSWRWLFVAGAIPVAASIVLIRRYVPESPVRAPASSTSGARCSYRPRSSAAWWRSRRARTGAGRRRGRSGWARSRSLLLLLWVLVELRTPEPLVDMRMMAPARGAVHERDGADRRLRDVRNVRPRARVRRDAGVRGLRVRSDGDGRGALPGAGLGDDAVRRARWRE